MKKKIFTLVALLAMTCGASAKNVYTTTTLWEDTYTDNIAIPVSSLTAGATITVYTTVTEGSHVRVFYNKNNSNKDQASFRDNDGTITDWNWRDKDSESYVFTVDEADMSILNDNTDETGSTGYLYIGSADASKLEITKITKTVTSTETETSTTEIWTGSEELSQWGGLNNSDLIAASKNAKKGDVFRVTVSNATASGELNVCNASGWAKLIGGSIVEEENEQCVEYEITDATTLEAIQQNGIIVYSTVNGTTTISKVELLTYASSYDCVSATIGSDGIATFSSKKKLDFSTTGVTPYYVSAVTTGTVTLTAATNATTWDWCGYILQGPEGTYDVPVTASATYPAAIYLKGQVDSGTVAASIEGTFHYIFAKNSSDVIGFYKLTADHTLAAHKAYLETSEDITPTGGSVKGLTLIFDDGEATAIRDMQEQQQEDEAFYNLSGIRVQHPTKGLYIVNGKKVLY